MEEEQNALSKKFLPISELFKKDLPPISWLIDGLVPEEAITILSGMSGSFKTWLVMEMAISIATGEVFLEKFETKQTGVLIIDEESGERLYNERFRLLTDLNKDIPIYLMSMSGFIVDDGMVQSIIGPCKERNIGLIVIDSLTRVNRGDENSSKDMAKLFASLRLLTKESISVLIIHHNRKPGQGNYDPSSDMRGSSDIRAAVDVQLAVRKTGKPTSIEVSQPKCRYYREMDPFQLTFCDDEDSGKKKFVYDGIIKNAEEMKNKQTEKLRETIIEVAEESSNLNKKTFTQIIVNKLGIGENRIKKEITDMLKTGILTSKTGPHNSALLSLSEEYMDYQEGLVS